MVGLDIFQGAADLIGKAMDFFGADDKAKAEAMILKLNQQHEIAMGQIEINKAQAQHRSIFVAGPRPAIMWVCVIALISEWLVRPWTMAFFPHIVIPSTSEMLIEMLFALLGLGGLRTYEKQKGLTK